jgi:Flp pilus assembly protein TadD
MSEGAKSMTQKQNRPGDRRKAEQCIRRGICAYKEWDIDQAVEHLQAAVRAAPDEPDYLLDLARVLARSGDYDQALKA